MANEKRLIHYDVLIAHLDSCIKQGKGLFKSVCVAIKCFVEQMPTVDAVEVVRCKDCIYYIETVGQDSGKPCGYGICGCTCQIITGIIYDEDFCSYGERNYGDQS